MSNWIWYPGDMELYFAMKQNFGRMERGLTWPAFWKSEGFRNRIVLYREYNLSEPCTFRFYAVKHAYGHCIVRTAEDEKKYPIGSTVTAPAGKVKIILHLACIETFPAAFIEGGTISSDGTWMAGDYNGPDVKAGYSRYFQNPEHEPTSWNYREEIYQPSFSKAMENSAGERGMLYGFETELTAQIEVHRKKEAGDLSIFEGESQAEALDARWCYQQFALRKNEERTPRTAVRYVFIPKISEDDVEVCARHQYIDIPVRAHFHSSDEQLNRIWKTAEHTFRLCSGIFFIDGVKRDTWIWSGDAYESAVVNRYLFGDADIDRRTFTALRGNDPVTTHINTIVDYSLLWIIGIEEHVEVYGDLGYLRFIWPKMVSLMDLMEGQRDENGFLTGRKQDWIYIDWADFDKDGPFCPEQMLLAAAFRSMAKLADVLSAHRDAEASTDGDVTDYGASQYRKEAEKLLHQIDRFFWDENQSAYVDSFVSGKCHVTKHAAILAILYDLVDDERKQILCDRVLLNPEVPAITTPYFQFFELDALCRMGHLREVWDQIHSYWGGMLDMGAVTFWEQFDPKKPLKEQYKMYGDPFGKSLCHAWAASPIYLISRYFIGLEVKDGGESYELHPHMEFFDRLDCVLPAGKKNLHIMWDGKKLDVEPSPVNL